MQKWKYRRKNIIQSRQEHSSQSLKVQLHFFANIMNGRSFPPHLRHFPHSRICRSSRRVSRSRTGYAPAVVGAVERFLCTLIVCGESPSCSRHSGPRIFSAPLRHSFCREAKIRSKAAFHIPRRSGGLAEWIEMYQTFSKNFF